MITVDDLQKFRQDLLEELINVLEQRRTTPARKWMKSHEVRRLLAISPNTLQALREKGTLPYTRVGGVIYYDFDDIKNMLDQNKQCDGSDQALRQPDKATGNSIRV